MTPNLIPQPWLAHVAFLECSFVGRHTAWAFNKAGQYLGVIDLRKGKIEQPSWYAEIFTIRLHPQTLESLRKEVLAESLGPTGLKLKDSDIQTAIKPLPTKRGVVRFFPSWLKQKERK